jgi:hypothetical protein
MHDYGDRAKLGRHHIPALRRAIVVAVLILVAAVTALAARLSHAASSPLVEISRAPEAAASDINVVHDIAIELVDTGFEELELSARLSDEGGLIQRPIAWKVRQASGETVFAGDVPVATLAISPGDYLVEAAYGTAHFARPLTVLAGNRLIVSFVLNVGGLRVLPRLKGLGLPPTASETLIYAASGLRKGELIATSAVPGEIIRVSAGAYRVVSRFAAGNAMAVTDVQVKPGIMSAVEIDHIAGLVRLSVANQDETDVAWMLADERGEILAPIGEPSAGIVLTPGTYTASAIIGGSTLTATFAIGSGEERDIVLGN